MASTTTSSSLYDAAVEALCSPLHQSATREALAAAAARRTRTVSDLQTYLRRVGLLSATTNSSNKPIVHVTGTKGKGSTACLCESLLRNRYGWNTGLFTSPHLVTIRERIRVNGRPVSKATFAQAYWTLRRRLEEAAKHKESVDDHDDDDNDDDDGLPVLPGYFRMLTVMALYIFEHYRLEDDDNQKRIDCIILEVGMGGRYDATNCIASSSSSAAVARGVTLIDYDHCRVLGNTLPEIAWEKGGIFQVDKGSTDDVTPHPKRQPAAFRAAVEQRQRQQQQQQQKQQDDDDDDNNNHTCFALDTNTDAVLEVLRQCAWTEGRGATLQVVDTQSPHNRRLPSDCPLGLPGDHQRANAELAIRLCEALVAQVQRQSSARGAEDDGGDVPASIHNDSVAIQQALASVSWPGRCQTVEYTAASAAATSSSTIPMTLRLDGAHTVQSVTAGLEWFRSVVTRQEEEEDHCTIARVLVFNCSHERNPVELLQLLVTGRFRAAYFCTADSARPSAVAMATATELLQRAGLTVRDDLLLCQNDNNNNNANDDGNNDKTPSSPSWQTTLASIWRHLEHEAAASNNNNNNNVSGDTTTFQKATDVASDLTVSEALRRCCEQQQQVSAAANRKLEVFVTGSLYLVGSALNAIQWQEEEAQGSLAEYDE